VSFQFKKEERNEDMKGMNAAFDPPSAVANSEVTDLDRAHAKTLHDAAKRVGRLQPRCKPSTWAGHFAKLRRDYSDDRVSAAVLWYSENVGKEYVPEAFCGSSFREKFLKVEAAMNRDRPKPVLVLNACPTSDDAKEIARKYLRDCEAFDAFRAELPTLIDRTMTNWRTFLAKLEVSPDQSVSAKAVGFLAGEFGKNPAHFARKWWEDMAEQVSNWDGWSGNASGLVFKPSHKRFVKACQDVFQGYPNLWAKVRPMLT
jgi:hypothetical protein